MRSTKWTYHKERSFPSKCFIFSKILFQIKNLYEELISCTNHPNVRIHTFRKRLSFILGGFFPESIINNFTKLFIRLVQRNATKEVLGFKFMVKL